MKKTFIFFITIISLTNCNNATQEKNNVEKSVVNSEAQTNDELKVIEQNENAEAETDVETQTNYFDKIYFDNFCVPVLHPGESFVTKPLDWNSNPDAKMFKTRITEAYKIGKINFAGHFITAIFGCGSSCIMGFMIDVETGKIYNLPLGESNSCLFADDRALYIENSRLFISGICRENPDSNEVYYKAFLWDESSKDKNEWKFVPVESDEFLIQKECKRSTPQRYIYEDE